jgi:hypothetical protein
MKKIFVFIILIYPILTFAQQNVDSITFKPFTPIETSDEDYSSVLKKKKRFSMGVAIGINHVNFNIDNYKPIGNNPSFQGPVDIPSGIVIDENSYLDAHSDNSIGSPGFKFGVISNFKLGENIELRFIPGIIFWTKNIYFNIPVFDMNNPSNNVNYYHVAPVFFDFPLLVKVKNDKFLSGRPYIVAGGSYQRNLSKSGSEAIIRLTNDVINAEIGMGLDNYFKKSRFSIELKVSISLDNIMEETTSGIPSQDVYSQSIQSIKANMFTLSFMFD